jgi:elongation factor Ts
MNNTTIDNIKKLREITGAPMGDCKKALEENGQDLEAARLTLKKQGLLVGVLRGGKNTSQGVVRANKSSDHGTLICLSCESDSVAKVEEFIAAAEEISAYSVDNTPEDLEDLQKHFEEQIGELMSTLKENIKLSYYSYMVGSFIAIYNHHNNNMSVLVQFNKEFDEQIGKDIAMQIAAMNPLFVDYDDIPQSVLNAEKKLAQEKVDEDEKFKDKHLQMREKIAKGMLDKAMDEMTLLNQKFTKNEKQTVGQYLESEDKDLKVLTFRSFRIGT